MKTIDNDQRKKLFGLAKAAHERSGSALPLDEWRHSQQAAIGIESLSDCPADLGLKLMNRLHRVIDGKEKDRKTGPAGGRPKGIMEWSGDQLNQLRKVEALLADMALPWDYADSIAKRMFGNSVLRVDTLNNMQMRAVISALVKRQQKTGGRSTEVRGQKTEAAHG